MSGGQAAAAPGHATALARADSFRLGGLEVRPPTREVVGDNVSLLLEPRVMQVLVALAERRGTVVSRAELIDECWAGRAVGDDAINRCIQAIRRIAEADGGFSIRTVARVGYRLEEADAAMSPCATAAAPLSERDATPTLVLGASERRHLTVLSCGLVLGGGTSLDPEVKYAISAEWRQLAVAAGGRFGAYVDSPRGDHMLACFGYPEAQEDAAERAVRAGLAVVEQTAVLKARLREVYGTDVSVQVGIQAGISVVAGFAEERVEFFGEALDEADRVASLAEPNVVTITGTVLNMVSGQLVAEAAGVLERGGDRQPSALYRVRSAGLVGERRRQGDPLLFVGREEEIALLASRWARARQGAGQLVLVHGEPGIGKSCLVDAFRERIAADPHLWIECRGEQLFANTALHAAAQMLWRGLGWRGDEGPEERLAALKRALERSNLKVAEAVPLVAEMLGLPEHYAPLLLAPEQRRRRLLGTLADWLFSAAHSQPLVLVIEDLQWLDPSSLELLHRLAEHGAGLPLLILCTARPEFHAAWPARSHHIQIALGGMTPAEMRRLVTGLTPEQTLDGGAVDAIVGRADGVPLFAEALTRLIGEQSGDTQIPATLLASLAARLERLGDAKEAAQIGAVIGRSFSWKLLRALSPMPEEALQVALDQLVEAGLIHARGTASDARYRFRHALIRDAAYGQLLGSQRRDWHRRVAEAMASGVVSAEPEELAHHWTDAGEADQAIAAWAKAGARAYSRNALAEAAHAYRQALSVLATQPDTPARDARELDLSAAFSLALVPAEGPQTAEVEAIVARNHELARRSGDIGVLVTARTYAFIAATFRSEWVQATRLADQVTELARDGSVSTRPETLAYARAMAHFCHFNASFYRGDFPEAESHFRKWEALNSERAYEERAVIVMAYGNGAILAWHLGDDAEAQQRIASAHAHAETLDSPFELCSYLMINGLLNVFQRDPEAVERLAGRALALAREHSFAQVEGWAGAPLGWARAQLGAPAEGVALIRASMNLLASGETRVSLPFFLTMLAEAQELDGDIAGAFGSLEEALSICPPERQYRPHALTCRGELAARAGESAQAEANFREAIATAELMGAVSCKQRASLGLATLRGG